MGLYSRDRPMWEFTATACQKDDTKLIDQAFSKASQHDDINDLELLNEFCALAIENNSTNVLMHLIKQGASVKSMKPRVVTWRGPRTKPILEILLAHG